VKTLSQFFLSITRADVHIHHVGVVVDGSDWHRLHNATVPLVELPSLLADLAASGYTRQPGDDSLIIYARAMDDAALDTGRGG